MSYAVRVNEALDLSITYMGWDDYFGGLEGCQDLLI